MAVQGDQWHEWPGPPLIPGAWKQLPAGETCALLARFSELELRHGFDPSAMAVEYRQARVCRLLDKIDWLLVEVQARFPDGAAGMLTLFYGPGNRLVPLPWFPYMAASLIWAEVDEHPSYDFVTEYVRLYVNCMVTHGERHTVCDDRAVATGILDPANQPDEAAMAAIAPMRVVTDGRGELGLQPPVVWAVTAHSGKLFDSMYRVEGNGVVELVEERPLAPIVLRDEEVSGPFRVFS